MAAPILAVILWMVLTVCVVLLTKNYAIKRTGMSPRSFWRNGLRVYISLCAMGSAIIMLVVYIFVRGIA